MRHIYRPLCSNADARAYSSDLLPPLNCWTRSMAIEVVENPDAEGGEQPRVRKFRRAMPPTFTVSADVNSATHGPCRVN
jgi:hypothetical protein